MPLRLRCMICPIVAVTAPIMPRHAHLLVRTRPRSLPRSMPSLLTDHARAFRRRHHRVDHLFQNRYKSIALKAKRHLLEPVSYRHGNPLWATVAPGLHALDRYPWRGHSALLRGVPRPGRDTQTILAQFGPTPARARRAYRAFVAAGFPRGGRPTLHGGGRPRDPLPRADPRLVSVKNEKYTD